MMLFRLIRPSRVIALLALMSRISAWAQPVTEYALKSALLFKLPQFIYRSDLDRNVQLNMCLLGQNPFGNALEKLAQNPIDGRSVRFIHLSSASRLSECEVVFISRSEANGVETFLRRIDKPVLTVSDINGFARAGGMVEFALAPQGGAISILINRRAAQQQGIEFNAQLLRLAKVVEP